MAGFALWSWGEIVYGCGARVAYAAWGAKAGGTVIKSPKPIVLLWLTADDGRRIYAWS